MDRHSPSMAEQIAQASSAFERGRTGHAPKSVNVVLSGDTLVITLRGALSPAETSLAKSPAGATRKSTEAMSKPEAASARQITSFSLRWPTFQAPPCTARSGSTASSRAR